ncbi:transglutaminase superfamily protein [Novosphingobium sp. PhB57]|uniref:lasso peptide biosynthesis B2 protein n=1 Tax=Novosphingobium sp. PhB57 TaxID=2485107 RepID=UPI001050F823|nr:lasso peptide biosynthesis B2 protein [Novosphingobium sp. PhB57]TCU51838.1 transglutaminase superfamily protein [Novosphingobium sp. PhB57]
MGYALRRDLTYCEVSDRLVFLDLAADRYFCLSPGLEAGFRAIAAGYADTSPTEETRALLLAGLISETPAPTDARPCASPNPVHRSLLDAPTGTARPLTIGLLTGGIAFARMALRIGRFHQTILRLSQRKAAIGRGRDFDPLAMRELATQFEWTARLTQAHDRCLPRSLALAHHAVTRGWPVDLVIGVQLRPFAAHCWVQAGFDLLNDRIDAVRPFTPILIV